MNLHIKILDALSPSQYNFLRCHAVFEKIVQKIGWSPPLLCWRPPLGNSGSGTVWSTFLLTHKFLGSALGFKLDFIGKHVMIQY